MRGAREAHQQRQHVGSLEQLLLAGGARVSGVVRLLQGRLPPPHQDLHPEAAATLRHQLADRAEAEDAEGRSAQPVRQRARPVAAPHAFGFERHVAARRQDQGERELGRRDRRIADARGDRNPELGAGRKIDHLGAATDQRDELQIRQPFQQSPGELGPFPDRHDNVGVAQVLDELVQAVRRLAIAHDVMVADQREAWELTDQILIVIRNNDLHPASPWFTSDLSKVTCWIFGIAMLDHGAEPWLCSFFAYRNRAGCLCSPRIIPG